MIKYDLGLLWRGKSRPRRTSIDLRPIQPTTALAYDLYSAAYRPLIARLTKALPSVVSDYQAPASASDARFTDAASDMQAVLDELAEMMRKTIEAVIPDIGVWASRVEKWHSRKWQASVLAGTGVDLDTILIGSGQPQSVADAIAWNVRLVKDVGEEAQTRISQEVFAAFNARKPARELAADLREIVDMSRRRSLGIASDQLTKLSSALDRERATQAGLKRYTWRHSAKRHPRPVHVARNGDIFAYADPPPDGPPGTLPFCGCRAQAKVEI